MTSFIIRRIGLAVLIIALAVTLLFCMIHLVPGDPVNIMLGPRASTELKAALTERMGLNDPLPVQIWHFFVNAIQGDLGTDVFSRRSVSDLVLEQLPHTLELIYVSLFWSALIGTLLGCHSAIHRNTLFDRISGVLSVGVISVPAFVVALYSLLIFAVALNWFPAIGAGDKGDLGDRLSHLVLPSLAIGLSWIGYIARMVRASMLEVLGETHIRTARSFGLTNATIHFRYALRVAFLPTITLLGVGTGLLLSAAVFVEIVFARPGIGKLIIDSITTRNYPVVMGTVLVSTVLFVLSTTISDIAIALLDPRSRSKR